jgi:hypothetical protein
VTLIGLSACVGREPVKPMQRLQLRAMSSPAGPGAAEPFVSSGPNGTVLLSWMERQPDSVTVALKVATADSSGRWSAPTDVAAATNLFVNWADFPSVVTLANGRLLAHWLQKSGPNKYAYDVQLAVSSDTGRTWTAAGMPHPAGVPVEHGFVTLLPRADSSADIVFLSGTVPPAGSSPGTEAPFHLSLAHFGRDGRLVDSVETLDARTCTCCQTAATMTSRGPVVLYRDRSESEVRDISILRRVAGAWKPAAPLHADGWVINGCPVNGPAVASAGDTVAAVWFTGARDTARVQLMFSTDAGATFGAPIRIDDGQPMGRLDVKLVDRNDALVTWTEHVAHDSAEVRARLVRIDGAAEPPFTITTLAAGRASGFPRMTRRGRDVVLAWTQPGPVSAVRLAVLAVAPR